jgi:heterodisulfide reductase subunit A
MTERLEKLHKKLVEQGMSPERFNISYVSAAEGLIFAKKMKMMDQQIIDLGKEKIIEENNKLRPGLEKAFKKKGLL